MSTLCRLSATSTPWFAWITSWNLPPLNVLFLTLACASVECAMRTPFLLGLVRRLGCGGAGLVVLDLGWRERRVRHEDVVLAGVGLYEDVGAARPVLRHPPVVGVVGRGWQVAGLRPSLVRGGALQHDADV